jgi:MraZ protein
MFQGHAIVNIDDKGRIIIPSKFRKHISSEANNLMIITLGRDNCLWLYPSDGWNKLTKKIEKINPFTKQETLMRRQMLFYTDECLMDTQHRILIPQKLFEKVGINKEVLLLGQLDKIELWNRENYIKYLEESAETYEDVLDKVMKNIPLVAPQVPDEFPSSE